MDHNMNTSQAAGTKANQVLGCIHEGFTSRGKELIIHCIQHVLGHTWNSVQAWYSPSRKGAGGAVPLQRQAGEGPRKGQKDDQKAGEPVLLGKIEGIRSFHPGEEKA